MSLDYELEPVVIDGERWAVLTPWHNQVQRGAFLAAWHVGKRAPLIMARDEDGIGCARMKNLLLDKAEEAGIDGVVVLDDDCYPDPSAGTVSLLDLIENHWKCLRPQPVPMAVEVTRPMSRGTPYRNRALTMPVAASMGFWSHVGDYDALGQLVHGATHPMEFERRTIFGSYFPLCGMNLAFYPKRWRPWCEFIDVSRFDDIWMGWLFEKEAYRRGHCFNLGGPIVRHSRQSNVWVNLRDEAKWLEANETIWQYIAESSATDYPSLRGLLPV